MKKRLFSTHSGGRTSADNIKFSMGQVLENCIFGHQHEMKKLLFSTRSGGRTSADNLKIGAQQILRPKAGEYKLGSQLHSHENLVVSLTKWPFLGSREVPLYIELQKPESE